ARAVDHGHSRDVVHRDLTPANVLLTADGTPKVADFGLAKRLGADDGRTQPGVVMGTPRYMAPEQAAGKSQEAGPAADIYALGVILYECLTGRPPFLAQDRDELLRQVVSEEPVPPARLRPRLLRDMDIICLKCLQKEPRVRYARATDLADELERVRTHRPIHTRAAGPLGLA